MILVVFNTNLILSNFCFEQRERGSLSPSTHSSVGSKLNQLFCFIVLTFHSYLFVASDSCFPFMSVIQSFLKKQIYFSEQVSKREREEKKQKEKKKKEKNRKKKTRTDSKKTKKPLMFKSFLCARHCSKC